MKSLKSRLSETSKLKGAVELDLEHLKNWAQTKQKGLFEEVLPFCLDLIQSGRGTYYLSHLEGLTKEEQRMVYTQTDSLPNITFTKPKDVATVKIHFTNAHNHSKPSLSGNELALSINEDGFANLLSLWIAEEIADVYTRNLNSKKTIPTQEGPERSKLLQDLEKNLTQLMTDYSTTPSKPSAEMLDGHLRGQVFDPRLILKPLIAYVEDLIQALKLVRESVDVRA